MNKPKYDGVTQTHDLNQAIESVKHYVERGYPVMIKTQTFSGIPDREHPHRYEYEVYVDFNNQVRECRNCIFYGEKGCTFCRKIPLEDFQFDNGKVVSCNNFEGVE